MAEPFIDADDVADVAVAALTDHRHVDEVYEVSGPRLLTFAEAARGAHLPSGGRCATGRSGSRVRGRAHQGGRPATAVARTVEVFPAILDGRNARLADGVQRALGRPPADFADYARAIAATGGWSST